MMDKACIYQDSLERATAALLWCLGVSTQYDSICRLCCALDHCDFIDPIECAVLRYTGFLFWERSSAFSKTVYSGEDTALYAAFLTSRAAEPQRENKTHTTGLKHHKYDRKRLRVRPTD